MQIKSITFSKFRNFKEPFTIPLDQRITFLVGPNNVGKSNIFRLLALFFGQKNGEIDEDLDFDGGSEKGFAVEVELPMEVLEPALVSRPIAWGHFSKSSTKSFKAQWNFTKTTLIKNVSENDFFKLIPKRYFEDQNEVMSDFRSSSSDYSSNLTTLLGGFWSSFVFPNTVLVPSDRHILTNGQNFSRFDPRVIPASSQIDMNQVVQTLANLDRPHGGDAVRQGHQERLQTIESFLAHCLEVSTVKLQIPNGQQTIYVTINGVQRPLSGMGTGVEQLILIALGMSEFKNKIVLIDEPELHLHPRTQKLMMQYLSTQTTGTYIVATHSSSILDSVEANIVRLEGTGRTVTGKVIENRNDLFQAVRNLGHSASELVQANFVIWVEGPSDRIYLNHLIQKFDPEANLVEGVDYTIIMYGGSVLANHSFEDTSEDFFKALSISRQFAVYADSDKAEQASILKSRVERVRTEVEGVGGHIWVSAGREIENYIP